MTISTSSASAPPPGKLCGRLSRGRWRSNYEFQRLRSEVDADHYQALDELHVHHLLRQRYGDIRYEERGVGPDFRVYEEGECIAGIEVLSLFQREDWSAEERRYWRLADELNRRMRPTDGYFVNFEIERVDQEPPPRRFADFIKRELAKLPPHETLSMPEGLEDAGLPTAVYDRDGVRIVATFIPMAAGAPSRSDPDARIVGAGPASGGLVNSGARLKERISAKSGGRYELAEIPFLVVVGVHDAFCSDDQVREALYGGESILIPSGFFVRRNDGLFGIDREHPDGRHRRVSAVAVVNCLHARQPAAADVAIFDNPYAARRWPDQTLPASRRLSARPPEWSEKRPHG